MYWYLHIGFHLTVGNDNAKDLKNISEGEFSRFLNQVNVWHESLETLNREKTGTIPVQ